MKIRDVLDYVIDLMEPVFSEKTMIRWLNQVEAEIQTEILLLAAEGIRQYTEEDADAELIAPPPFDKLYEDYLIWRIALAQEEAERANNAQVIYEQSMLAYSRFVCDTINPGNGTAEAERYYLSAYQLAVKYGFKGTEEEWLESLKGTGGGGSGADGKSAYEIAQEHGFKGTEAEWLQSLVGEAGFSPIVKVNEIVGGHSVSITDSKDTQTFNVMDGTNGKNGISPSVSVSTITGGHTVTIKDADGDHSFNVMDGEDGTGGGGSYSDWTAEDKAAVVADTIAALPRYNGEVGT